MRAFATLVLLTLISQQAVAVDPPLRIFGNLCETAVNGPQNLLSILSAAKGIRPDQVDRLAVIRSLGLGNHIDNSPIRTWSDFTIASLVSAMRFGYRFQESNYYQMLKPAPDAKPSANTEFVWAASTFEYRLYTKTELGGTEVYIEALSRNRPSEIYRVEDVRMRAELIAWIQSRQTGVPAVYERSSGRTLSAEAATPAIQEATAALERDLPNHPRKWTKINALHELRIGQHIIGVISIAIRDGNGARHLIQFEGNIESSVQRAISIPGVDSFHPYHYSAIDIRTFSPFEHILYNATQYPAPRGLTLYRYQTKSLTLGLPNNMLRSAHYSSFEAVVSDIQVHAIYVAN